MQSIKKQQKQQPEKMGKVSRTRWRRGVWEQKKMKFMFYYLMNLPQIKPSSQ